MRIHETMMYAIQLAVMDWEMDAVSNKSALGRIKRILENPPEARVVSKRKKDSIK